MIHLFCEPQPVTLSQVGGKALSLIRMTQAGLPVPQGCVCTVDFFSDWIAQLRTSQEWLALEMAVASGDNLAGATEALKKRCEEKLKEAEEKVAAITLDGDGNPTGTKPVEGL